MVAYWVDFATGANVVTNGIRFSGLFCNCVCRDFIVDDTQDVYFGRYDLTAAFYGRFGNLIATFFASVQCRCNDAFVNVDGNGHSSGSKSYSDCGDGFIFWFFRVVYFFICSYGFVFCFLGRVLCHVLFVISGAVLPTILILSIRKFFYFGFAGICCLFNLCDYLPAIGGWLHAYGVEEVIADRRWRDV